MSYPSSLNVGTSGNSGWRFSIATANMRTASPCFAPTVVYPHSATVCFPSKAVTAAPVPLNGTYVVRIPASLSNLICAKWFALALPDPDIVTWPGLAFASVTKSARV